MNKTKINKGIIDSALIKPEKKGEVLDICLSGDFKEYDSRNFLQSIDEKMLSHTQKIIFSDNGVKEWESLKIIIFTNGILLCCCPFLR